MGQILWPLDLKDYFSLTGIIPFLFLILIFPSSPNWAIYAQKPVENINLAGEKK